MFDRLINWFLNKPEKVDFYDESSPDPKAKVDFYTQVVRNQRAIEIFKAHDPFFEHNYATAEKWACGELHAEGRSLDPYQFDFDEKVNFNKYKHLDDHYIKLQTRIIQIILKDFDYGDQFPNRYDFDPKRITVLKKDPKHYPKNLSADEQKLLAQGLDEIQQALTPFSETNWKIIEYGKNFRSPNEYKDTYSEEQGEKIKINFIEQIILNQKALKIFKEIEEETGEFMPSVEAQIKNFENEVTCEKVGEKTYPDQPNLNVFTFDVYALKRNFDSYLELQTNVIFQMIETSQLVGNLLDGVSLSDYDLNKHSITKVNMKKASNVLKDDLYDEQDAALLRQGLEDIKTNTVDFFTFPKKITHTYTSDIPKDYNR